VLLALGMTATTFSVAAAAYQSHLMKEKKWGVVELATHAQVDTVVGIGVLGAITVVVLMTSAGVLVGRGGTFSAEKMALQLEPLAGPAAYYLFLAGFFFASFSSLVVNPLIGATLLVDGMAGDSSIDSRSVRGWTIMTLVSGVGVVVVFGASPVELLRAAQAMAAIAFPVLGFLIWKLSSDRETMGGHANGLCLNILAVLGYLAILGIVGNYLYQILFRG
jgi:Mn2+/Fe2+ NRAMP family transporter